VSNTSLNQLQGTFAVTLNGQIMQDANPHSIVLNPGESYSGQAWIANAPPGDVTLRAQYGAAATMYWSEDAAGP
jgi:hypothetical protein